MTIRRLVVAGLVAVLSAPAGLTAQGVRASMRELLDPARKPEAPLVAPTGLTWRECIALTLRHNATLLRGRQEVLAAEGSAREARGLFDTVLALGPGGQYVREQLQPFALAQEVDRRNRLQIVATVFDEINRGVRAQLAANTPRPPFCPTVFELGGARIGPVREARVPRDDNGFRFDPFRSPDDGFNIIDGLLRTPFGTFRISDLCRPPGDDGGVGPLADLWRRLNSVGRYGLDAVIDAANAIPFETLSGIRELSEALGTRAGLAVQRIGPVPQDELRKSLFIEARLEKLLRTGLRLGSTLRLSSEESRFVRKSADPAFGGRNVPTRFPSFAEVGAELPLGQGLGRTATAGAERAAEFAASARREQFRQQVAEEVFRTTLAYVSLAASEQRAALTAQSGERQQTILRLSEDLLTAGELAEADLNRLRGRLAATRDAHEAAMLSVLVARQGLMQAVGARTHDLRAGPVAADGLVLPPTLPTTEGLTDLALVERRDPKVVSALHDASAALAAAASADMRHQITLSLRTGLSTLYESPAYRYFPDEVDPILSDLVAPRERDSPVRVGSIRGYGRLFAGAWKPYALVSLTFDIPLANRAARGRAQQADAALRQSRIQVREVERSIRTGVVQAGRNVRTLAQALAARTEAVAHQHDTLDAAIEQFRLGEITMIDLLVTENDLTNEEVELVQQQQLYAVALARLGYETGTLVAFRSAGSPVETVEVRAFP